MEHIYEYEFNGYKATVIQPEQPNGKWIWKTEFLYAFDQAEIELVKKGYTRVYYQISDMYGNYQSIRLMHTFYLHVIEKFNLDKKCVLFGFSRGGLYAFNYAVYYPETVDKIYLDAPVLDLTDWPNPNHAPKEYNEMLDSYNLTVETLKTFKDTPIYNLDEFFRLGIPMLLVAGDSDDVVHFGNNSEKVIAYCKEHGIPIFPLYKQVAEKDCGKLNPRKLSYEFREYCPNHQLKDLRHTFTTRARECGIDNELVAVWTGHSLGNITSSVYTHFSIEFQQEQAKKLVYI